jgi:Lyase
LPPSPNFEAQAAQDAAVEASGALKTVAVSLVKIANDIRWLGSGPRGRLGELRLPPTQPGSLIMPGPVNPVMCEMVIQVGAQVVGNDAVITFGGMSGNFELNTMLPVIAYILLQLIGLLANVSLVFAHRRVVGRPTSSKAPSYALPWHRSSATTKPPSLHLKSVFVIQERRRRRVQERRRSEPETIKTIMGDKSPKAVNKKTNQKQAEKNTADQKKQQAAAAKQPPAKK